MKLLKLTQIENGKPFYINSDEIASINPTFKMKHVEEVIVGQDNNLYYTLITLKNGVKVNAAEKADAIAYCGIATQIVSVPKKKNKPAAVVATEPAPAWSEDANLERSKQIQSATGPVTPNDNAVLSA